MFATCLTCFKICNKMFIFKSENMQKTCFSFLREQRESLKGAFKVKRVNNFFFFLSAFYQALRGRGPSPLEKQNFSSIFCELEK